MTPSLFAYLFADTGIFLVETFNPAGRINDLLFPRHEGMTLGTDFHLDVLFRRAGGNHVSADTGNGRFIIGGMDAFFHFF